MGEQLLKMQADGSISLDILELDLLRSEEHDVLQEPFWEAKMRRLDTGHYRVLVITPPCNTHSRARNSNAPKPKPVHSKRDPLGFPWLQGSQLKEVMQANKFVDLTFNSCRQAHQAKAGFLIEHPEDLGAAADGIWALQKMFSLAADTKAVTAAFFQCPFGAVSAKPTRVVTTLPIKSVPVAPPIQLFFF